MSRYLRPLPQVQTNVDGRIAFRPDNETEWWVVTPVHGRDPLVGWQYELDGDGWWPMRPAARGTPARFRDEPHYEDPKLEDA